MSEKTNKRRPYWHVDAKWISGILFFFSLSSALLLYNLSELTERDRAINITTAIVSSIFSKAGLDEKSVAELKQKAAAIPGDSVAPIEQLPSVRLTKQEIVTLSPEQLKEKVFRQVTEPIYDNGVKDAADGFTNDPKQKEEFIKNATLLGGLTAKTHQMFQQSFIGAMILTLVFLVGLILFSAGWGRLVSPAITLLLVSPLGSMVGLLLLHPPTDGDAPLAALPVSVAREIGSSLNHSYLLAAMVGLVLLAVALVGKIIQKITHKPTREEVAKRNFLS